MAIRPLSDPLPAELALDEAPFDVDEFEQLEPEQLTDEHPSRRWTITDDGAAEWAMRLLAAKQAEVDELAVKRDDWIDRIVAWFDHGAKGPQRTIAHFEALLERYAAERYEATKAATLSLPSGKVSSRKVGGAVDVVDAAAVVEWIRENLPDQVADLVKDEPTPKIQPLRKLLKVVEQEVGTSVDCSLECGHFVVIRLEVDDEPAALLDATTECVDCGLDPIDETYPLRKITEIDEQAVVERIVITENGERVPGVTVSDEGRSYTVKAGG